MGRQNRSDPLAQPRGAGIEVRRDHTIDTAATRRSSGTGDTVSPKRGAYRRAMRDGRVASTGPSAAADRTDRKSDAAMTTLSRVSIRSRASDRQPCKLSLRVTSAWPVPI